MLDILFGRLTGDRAATAAFDALTRIARHPRWYMEAGVPDTLDGRFAMLSTTVALAIVRLEQCGDEGERASVALIERFIEVMESEHRELGLGDPTLGKTVRKLVASLERRTDCLRSAIKGQRSWENATRDTLFKTGVTQAQARCGEQGLRDLWAKIATLSVGQIEQGQIP